MGRARVPQIPADLIARYGRNGVATGWMRAHQTPVKAAKQLALMTAPGSAFGPYSEQTYRLVSAGIAAGLAAQERCQHCGMALSDPESVARRIGPDCWAKGYRPPLDLDAPPTPKENARP